MNARFHLVDVFHSQPMTGNPLAVVFDAPDLSTAQMLQVTRWLNLSETTFLVPPISGEADYGVRIFTLDRELPFAGHPTLGTCHAWLEAGGKPRNPDRIIQECGAGLVPIRRAGDTLAFAAPALIRGGFVDPQTLDEVASVLQIERSRIVDAQWGDNGPGWVILLLESAREVLAIEPLRAYGRRVDIGIVGPYPPGNPIAFEVRAIFSDHHLSLIEDPVTGSLNASVAQWLLATGRARAPYVAAQGAKLGRAGRIHIDQDADGTVWVGGKATSLCLGSHTFRGDAGR